MENRELKACPICNGKVCIHETKVSKVTWCCTVYCDIHGGHSYGLSFLKNRAKHKAIKVWNEAVELPQRNWDFEID